MARLSGGDERLAPATDCTSGPRFQSLPLKDTPHHTTRREDSFQAQQPLVLVEPAGRARRESPVRRGGVGWGSAGEERKGVTKGRGWGGGARCCQLQVLGKENHLYRPTVDN